VGKRRPVEGRKQERKEGELNNNTGGKGNKRGKGTGFSARSKYEGGGGETDHCSEKQMRELEGPSH